MKKIILIQLLLSMAMIMNAQTDHDYKATYLSLPAVLPTTPNAASLKKFGNLPVDHYTGTANISIPIYEINLSGKKIPISLSYNASGIKVAQEASWVGLGWSLNAGGFIVRENMDKYDFGTPSYLGYWQDYTIENIYNSGNSNHYLDYTSPWGNAMGSSRNPNIDTPFYTEADSEPDLFMFNVANHSGTLFLQRHNTVAIVKNRKDYVHVTYDNSNGSWTIIDGDGFKYVFGVNEESKDRIGINYMSKSYGVSQSVDQNILGTGKYNIKVPNAHIASNMVTNAWYIDYIEAPNKEKIEFEYTTDTVTSPAFVQEEIRFKEPGTGGSFSPIVFHTYNYSIMNQSVLKKIKFPNGSIDFVVSTRKDLDGNNYKGKDTAPAPHKLDYISIKNASGEIASYTFHYSYLGNENDYNTCRLMLDKVIEKNAINGMYEFSYNRGYLPKKNSSQIDFWGYYNASLGPKIWGDKTNMIEEGSLIPPLNIPLENKSYYYAGRDRSPVDSLMQHGMLTSVKYPTGGTTELTYEPHDFDNKFFIAQGSQVLDYLNLPGPPNWLPENPYKYDPYIFSINEARGNTPQSNSTFSVEYSRTRTYQVKDTTNVNYELTLISAPDSYFTVENLGSLRIFPLNLEIAFPVPRRVGGGNVITSNTKEGSLILYPNQPYRVDVNNTFFTYLTSLNPPSDGLPHRLSVKHLLKFEFKSNVEKWITQGGGLRVKKIIDKNLNGEKLSHKYFNYSKDNKSSGYMFITPLHYTNYVYDEMDVSLNIVMNDVRLDSHSIILVRSSPIVDLTPKMASSPIAYSQVEEMCTDGFSTTKTIYSFENKHDVYPGYAYEQIPQTTKYNPSTRDFFKNPQGVIPNQPALIALENGLVEKICHYDKNNQLVRKQTFGYQSNSQYTTEIHGLSRFKFFSSVESRYSSLLLSEGYPPTWFRAFSLSPSHVFKHYYYQSNWLGLGRETITDYFNQGQDSIVKTTDYMYDNLNYLPRTIKTTDSQSKQVENKIIYTSNYGSTITEEMKARHMVNLPVQFSNYVNNIFADETTINYGLFNNLHLKGSVVSQKKDQNNQKEQRVTYHNYDAHGNPQYVSKDDADKVVYLWSYNYQHLVAEIKNVTYSQVESILTKTYINNLAESTNPNITPINDLRKNSNMKNAFITTYTYKPLVGVQTITDPSGKITYYEYDLFNRLKQIKDMYGNILENYEYQYQNQ